jgi:hypothetical protein
VCIAGLFIDHINYIQSPWRVEGVACSVEVLIPASIVLLDEKLLLSKYYEL